VCLPRGGGNYDCLIQCLIRAGVVLRRFRRFRRFHVIPDDLLQGVNCALECGAAPGRVAAL
jgi:hypothetical protein